MMTIDSRDLTYAALCTQKSDLGYLSAFEMKTQHDFQDVSCIRCNEVRVRDISSLCECSGKFSCMESGQGLLDLIRTVRSLADFYKMEILKSTVDWMLGTVGTRRTPAVKVDRKIIL